MLNSVPWPDLLLLALILLTSWWLGFHFNLKRLLQRREWDILRWKTQPLDKVFISATGYVPEDGVKQLVLTSSWLSLCLSECVWMTRNRTGAMKAHRAVGWGFSWAYTSSRWFQMDRKFGTSPSSFKRQMIGICWGVWRRRSTWTWGEDSHLCFVPSRM